LGTNTEPQGHYRPPMTTLSLLSGGIRIMSAGFPPVNGTTGHGRLSLDKIDWRQ
jgi:hypothetical protein